MKTAADILYPSWEPFLLMYYQSLTTAPTVRSRFLYVV